LQAIQIQFQFLSIVEMLHSNTR